MAFKGDLQNISLFDIFQTLSTNGQMGVLVLTREGVTKKVYFAPDGVRVLFARSFLGFRIGDVFVRRGLVTQQDIEILLIEQRSDYRPLGELLVESGKVTDDDVQQVLRYHAEDEIYEIFGWKLGTFAFHDGQEITQDDMSPLSDVVLDPSALCLEAARRLDELEHIRTLVPENDAFYIQKPGIVRPDENETEEKICLVFDLLTDPANVDELRDRVGLSQFDVLRAIYLLLEGEYIRPLEVEELMDAAILARQDKNYLRATDLLERAHLLDKTDPGILEACVEVARRLDDSDRLGALLAALGALKLEAGDLDEGIDHLELALKNEPSNLVAMTALRDAYVENDDIERAADLSLRMSRTYAENNHLFQAVESARVGLEVAPHAIALRYYLAQLLARTSRNDEAKAELYHLIEETEGSKKAMRSAKAHELLSSCYRLLLRIDPLDARAVEGRSLLGRRKMAVLRRQRLFVRGGIVAGVLAVAAGIAMVMGGPGPDKLLESVQQAAASNDRETMLTTLDELVRRFPESPEASQALEIKRKIEQDHAGLKRAHRDAQNALRETLTAELDAIREALTNRQPMLALRDVEPFLAELDRKRAGFLRRELATHLEHALGVFLERITHEYDQDQRTFSHTNVHLNSKADKTVEELEILEKNLEEVRMHNWRETIPSVSETISRIGKSKHIGNLSKRIETFRKKCSGGTMFTAIDGLYYTARARRLRRQIDDEYQLARTEGRTALESCEFERARAIFGDLHALATDVADEQPRKHFLELLGYLERTGIRKESVETVERIDIIVGGLDKVERLKTEGVEKLRSADLRARAEAGKKIGEAFRTLRGLVNSNRLIRFEEHYRIPYLVRSTPSGCAVTMDGKEAGITPVAIDLPIYAATEIIVRRPGFEDASRKIEPLDSDLVGDTHLALKKEIAWMRRLSGEIEATPVVSGDLLLVASRNGMLVAIRRETGKTEFVVETGVLEGIKATPVADEKHAYVITLDGVLHVVDLATHKITKTVRLPDQVQQGPALVDGTLYAATRSGRLVAVRDGKIVYDEPLARMPTTPLLHVKGRLLVGTMEGEILVHTIVDGKEERTLKPRYPSSFLGGLTYHQGLIVAGTENGKVHAFDFETGRVRWMFPTMDVVRSRPVGAGDRIYVGSTDGRVYALTLAGKQIVRFEVAGSVSGDPAVLSSFVYAGGTRNTISAFNTIENIAWWTHEFGKEIPVHVVPGEERLFVVTDAGRIYCFEKDAR